MLASNADPRRPWNVRGMLANPWVTQRFAPLNQLKLGPARSDAIWAEPRLYRNSGMRNASARRVEMGWGKASRFLLQVGISQIFMCQVAVPETPSRTCLAEPQVGAWEGTLGTISKTQDVQA